MFLMTAFSKNIYKKMRTKLLFFLFFLLISFIGLKANTASYQSQSFGKQNSISNNFTNFISYTPKANLSNGLKKLYTLLLITVIIFTLLAG
jgi:ABC-type oligopeptide transport system substrate-binding subunit